MQNFFVFYMIAILAVTLAMLAFLFRKGSVYDRFIGILVISTKVILILVLIGFIDGRTDMYVDIAISYAILGFISSVILAKFLGTNMKGDEEDNGN